MAQAKELKKRIKSIGSTKKVTHAMELIAAAKMKKSQIAALASRPYSISLNELLNDIKNQTSITHPLLKTNKSLKQLIILITSDRGLAGGLNINLFRDIIKKDLGGALYITVGKKALNFANKSASEILASYQSDEMSHLDLARILTKMARTIYTQGKVTSVKILYSHFESTIKQTPKWFKLLPIELENIQSKDTAGEIQDIIFEPQAQKILDYALPHHLLTQTYQVLLEAKASEHSARMVAMKNATDAAGDLIDDLTLTYNQVRQEAITKELLDIVTAQKAFN